MSPGIVANKQNLDTTALSLSPVLPDSQYQQPTNAPMPALSSKHPPCRVCSGKATGIHYGVNTCGACKSFFSRYSSKYPALKCKNSSSCVIEAKRKQCPPCRYKKCMDLGMSRDNVKIGRSTYIQVTAAIEEVKRLEMQLKIKRDGTLVTHEEHMRNMDELVHRMTDMHLDLMPKNSIYYTEMYSSEQLYLENLQYEEALFGQRRHLPRSQYNEIYEKTQLDVDGRRARLTQIIPAMEKGLMFYCRFATCIPGYTQLDYQDQRALLSTGLLQSACILHVEIFNTETGIFVYPHNTSIIVNMTELMAYSDNESDIDLYRYLMKLVLRVQQLDLTEEEKVTAAALCFLLCDVDLSDEGRRIVSANTELLSEALQQELSRNHDRDQCIYAKLMTIITEMSTITRHHIQHSKNMMQDLKDMPFPRRLRELYG